MPVKPLLERLNKLTRRFRIDNGSKFRLSKFDPADTEGLASKEEGAELLKECIEHLCGLQEKLYAQDTWALLCVFQAMDAAGKDSAIKHVLSGVNPQGVEVHPFKAPNSTELDHDFLWRTHLCAPQRGRIGIFNRSYYEEVLVVRVHRELLENQKLPASLLGKKVWRQRLEDIAAHEKYLSHNGVAVRKFFLNVSKKEQKKRFFARLDEPEKNWKFSPADVTERQHWDEYMEAYEEAIQNTATPQAPWYVVPADSKWFTRVVVAGAMIEALEELDLAFPTLSEEKLQELQESRRLLEAEK